jgi:hypothetical protein
MDFWHNLNTGMGEDGKFIKDSGRKIEGKISHGGKYMGCESDLRGMRL